MIELETWYRKVIEFSKRDRVIETVIELPKRDRFIETL